MVCNSLSTSSFQTGPRRIIFPMLHRNDEATNDNSDENSSFITTPKSCSPKAGFSDHPYNRILRKSSSVDSDMPSLGSLSSSSEQGSLSSGSDSDVSVSDRESTSKFCLNQIYSKKTRGEGKLVRFDPRIWVHEFHRNQREEETLWFTSKEMNSFKAAAIQCIIAYNSKALSYATDSAIFKSKVGSGKVLYSHPALGVNGEYDSPYGKRDIISNVSSVSQFRVNQFRDAVSETEIRNILIVNSHDVFLKLFAKGMRKMFPHANITTVKTKEDALIQLEQRCSKKKTENSFFDVVVVDSTLQKNCIYKANDESLAGLCRLMLDMSRILGGPDVPTKSLFVGVCSDIKTGTLKLKANGADIVWQKPPPLMDDSLRDTLLSSLLTKRGRIPIVKKLF